MWRDVFLYEKKITAVKLLKTNIGQGSRQSKRYWGCQNIQFICVPKRGKKFQQIVFHLEAYSVNFPRRWIYRNLWVRRIKCSSIWQWRQNRAKEEKSPYSSYSKIFPPSPSRIIDGLSYIYEITHLGESSVSNTPSFYSHIWMKWIWCNLWRNTNRSSFIHFHLLSAYCM